MINTQILALRERKKREQELKKRAQARTHKKDSAYRKAQPFSHISCGIAPIEHSTNWAMQYTAQQDNTARGTVGETSLHSSLKRSKVFF